MNAYDFIYDELLSVIPCLWVIGCILKYTSFINNKYIPLILFAVALIAGIVILGFTFAAFTQGVLLTGVAIFGHELVKETYFRKKESP